MMETTQNHSEGKILSGGITFLMRGETAQITGQRGSK